MVIFKSEFQLASWVNSPREGANIINKCGVFSNTPKLAHKLSGSKMFGFPFKEFSKLVLIFRMRM